MSFLGSLFGTDQAKSDLINYSNQSGGAITGGQTQAQGNYGTGYNAFNTAFSPYAAGGQRAYQAGQDILGLNGTAAQAQANQGYFNNPAIQQWLKLTSQDINRSYAPTGQTGAATQAFADALTRGYTGYQNTLLQQGAQGQEAGRTAGTMGYQYGSDLGGLNFGAAQLQANRLMGTGNAVANYDVMPATMGLNFLGSAAKIGAAAMMASDKKVKHGIKHVGYTHDGQNIYSFKYRGDPDQVTHMGLIAQEVERRHPEAVGHFGGVKAVDYASALAGAHRRAA